MSIEELVEDLKTLTPEQLDHVVRIVHGFSAGTAREKESRAQVEMPQTLVDEALRHGWPRDLFTKLIGSLPELERLPQPMYDLRETP